MKGSINRSKSSCRQSIDNVLSIAGVMQVSSTNPMHAEQATCQNYRGIVVFFIAIIFHYVTQLVGALEFENNQTSTGAENEKTHIYLHAFSVG